MRSIRGAGVVALSACFSINISAANEVALTQSDRQDLAALISVWSPPQNIWQVAFFTSSELLYEPVEAIDIITPRPIHKPKNLRTARLRIAPQSANPAGALRPGGSGASRSPGSVRDHVKPLLGSVGSRTAFSPVTRRWTRVRELGDESQVTLNTCLDDPQNCASQDMSKWAALIRDGEGLRKGHRITHVNRVINRMLTYREDIDLWRRAEYWATPEETLGLRAGDCEDYAILKYWSLRQLGFADRDMRIVALRDRAARQNHAVLAVYYGGDWLILDNRFSRVRLQRDLPNYQPLYSVNRAHQWSHTGNSHKPVRLAARLKQFGLK